MKGKSHLKRILKLFFQEYDLGDFFDQSIRKLSDKDEETQEKWALDEGSGNTSNLRKDLLRIIALEYEKNRMINIDKLLKDIKGSTPTPVWSPIGASLSPLGTSSPLPVSSSLHKQKRTKLNSPAAAAAASTSPFLPIPSSAASAPAIPPDPSAAPASAVPHYNDGTGVIPQGGRKLLSKKKIYKNIKKLTNKRTRKTKKLQYKSPVKRYTRRKQIKNKKQRKTMRH